MSREDCGWLVWLVTACHVGVTAVVFHLVDTAQPDPYMDEVFHVPQARKYCNGKYLEWDDKITTLPGLYFVSVGILNPLSAMMQRFHCDTSHLRMVNLLMSAVTLPILHRIITQIHGNKHYYDDFKGLLSAFNLSMFPLFYFFTFLYYTDVGSTFLVILMYSLHLDRQNLYASFIGLLAVLFRQTNIIWVAFTAMQAIGPSFIHMIHSKLYENQKTLKFSLTTWGQTREVFEGTVLLLQEPVKLVHFVFSSLKMIGGYLIVGLLFLLFVIVNRGVVVGDKAAHEAHFHPTQVLYFALFTGSLTWSFCSTKIFLFILTFCRKHYLIVAFGFIMVTSIVNSYTLAHPYLLADNRHYTFYLWRRIFMLTPWSKFVLVPFYVFFIYCIFHSIRRNNIVFKLTFPLCVLANLSPQLLLEFRYFVVPFFLYRVQVRPQTWWKLWCETGTYALINCLTLFLFINKPFQWDHEPGQIQRFMW